MKKYYLLRISLKSKNALDDDDNRKHQQIAISKDISRVLQLH